MKIIDGTTCAKRIREKIREEIAGERAPSLAVVLVGEDPASKIYVKRKFAACEEVGFRSVRKELPESVSEEELLREIEALNRDDAIDGILVQLPLPKQIDTRRITRAIDPAKDVDGFHPINVGKLYMGESDGFAPCTPLGIQTLLKEEGIDVEGMNAVILGRSNIVGKPMASLLMQKGPGGNATVTVVHQHTKNLEEHCQSADLLIAAIGRPKMVTASMVKEGAVVVDVGINRVEDPTAKKGYRIVGDVDFDAVKEKCKAITPVPGGVGPMTIAMLLQNTLKSFHQRCG